MTNREKKHTRGELQQLQSLPLDAKITLTKERIKQWYENWARIEIVNKKTGNKRVVLFDCRNPLAEPELKNNEYIDSWITGSVYVAFSGGKDSTVLKHIVDQMYNDVPCLFVNTGLEYPEIQRFVRDVKAGKYDCFNSNVDIMRPEMRFDEVIKKYGYPVPYKEVANKIYHVKRSAKNTGVDCRETYIYKAYFTNEVKPKWYKIPQWEWLLDADFDVSGMCCDIMKKRTSHKYGTTNKRAPIVGMQADESKLRLTKWMNEGCNAFDNVIPQSNPMSFWTQQDILQYIIKYDVPYCNGIYGDIVPADNVDGQVTMFMDGCKLKTTNADRTGCIFCMFGILTDNEPNRFQRMKVTHPKQWSYCMKPLEEGGLGIAHVLDVLGVKYE